MKTKYFIDPDGKLYHSDDELMHWKYVKREKVNGKWKYYYDWSELKSDIKNNGLFGLKARKRYTDAKKTSDEATKKNESMIELVKKTFSNSIRDGEFSKEDEKELESVQDKQRSTRADMTRKETATQEAKAEYDKTIIGSAEKAVASGVEYIKDKLGFDEKVKYDESTKKLERAKKDYADAVKSWDGTEQNSMGVKYAEGQISDAADYLDSYEKKYRDTPLGKLDTAVDAGRDWMTDLLEKLTKGGR